MKKVLWISRHTMTEEQLADLERAIGGRAELTPWKETVRDVGALAEGIAAADVIAAVLPPELMQELLAAAGGKPVLRAVSGRRATGRVLCLADGRREEEFAFVHLYWEEILSIEIKTRRL